MGRFDSKIVVVTGSSRGIGRAIAEAFLNQGATVVGVARSASSFNAANYRTMDFDLGTASAKQINELVTQIGAIDVLVNNAGIIRRAPAVEYSQNDWDEVIHLNLTVPFLLMQAVARDWIQQKRDGRLKIVNIASLLSFQGGILVPAYAASKHGMAGLTKALANEWASLRINVNAVAPGYIETENTAALRGDPMRSASILARIPEGRWGQGDDIAGACLFLASADADYVNGAILNVDGGWMGR